MMYLEDKMDAAPLQKNVYNLYFLVAYQNVINMLASRHDGNVRQHRHRT